MLHKCDNQVGVHNMTIATNSYGDWCAMVSGVIVEIRYCPFCKLDLSTVKMPTKAQKLYEYLYDTCNHKPSHHVAMMSTLYHMSDEELEKILAG